MARISSNRLEPPTPSGSEINPEEQQQNKKCDGVERRSGGDRRKIAYLQGDNRRKCRDRRRNSKK